MNKKIVYIILIIILLIIGFAAFNNFFNEKVKVGNTYFILPNGYDEISTNNIGDISINNGTNPIYFHSYGNISIDKAIKEYKDSIAKNNQTVSMDKFTVNDIFVNKTTNNINGASHYWFIVNDETYAIYTWDNNPYADTLCKQLISSMTPAK